MDIKKLRLKNNITQFELAKRCGVSLTTVRMWDAGVSVPKEKHHRILKDILEVE